MIIIGGGSGGGQWYSLAVVVVVVLSSASPFIIGPHSLFLGSMLSSSLSPTKHLSHSIYILSSLFFPLDLLALAVLFLAPAHSWTYALLPLPLLYFPDFI